MRCATAHQFRKRKGSGAPIQLIPREGTKIREAFDLFQSNKGLPVEWRTSDNTILVYLTDFYGLDIRTMQRGNSRTGRKSVYLLAGEWFGRVYIDYVAERLSQARRAA